MKRRYFIKTSALAALGVSFLPNLSFSQNEISNKELIGKGNPKLFGNGYQLRKEAHNAFIEMKKAALNSGVKIQVVSSYRNYDHQKRIWNRKYKTYINKGLTEVKAIEKIIEYSTIPGTSRHHWATDVDIIDASVKQPKNVLSPKNFTDNGCYFKLKQWLDEHANNFGFYLVYTNDNNRKGFKYEPWHFTYAPLSTSYLKAYRTLDLEVVLKQNEILGNSNFSSEFIEKYLSENILDINTKLL